QQHAVGAWTFGSCGGAWRDRGCFQVLYERCGGQGALSRVAGASGRDPHTGAERSAAEQARAQQSKDDRARAPEFTDSAPRVTEDEQPESSPRRPRTARAVALSGSGTRATAGATPLCSSCSSWTCATSWGGAPWCSWPVTAPP